MSDHPRDWCCSCHLNPPCSYCVAGGYCDEHDCMREDCGGTPDDPGACTGKLLDTPADTQRRSDAEALLKILNERPPRRFPLDWISSLFPYRMGELDWSYAMHRKDDLSSATELAQHTLTQMSSSENMIPKSPDPGYYDMIAKQMADTALSSVKDMKLKSQLFYKLREKETEVPTPDKPWLCRSNRAPHGEGYAVLFTARHEGTVIHVEPNAPYKLGDHVDSWEQATSEACWDRMQPGDYVTITV